MEMWANRRQFLGTVATGAAAAGLAAGLRTSAWAEDKASKPAFKISLAEWSLHKAIFGKKLDNLDFAKYRRKSSASTASEVRQPVLQGQGEGRQYLDELNKRAARTGVTTLLIMIDGEGRLGDPDDKKRTEAIENHYKWVEAAKHLGCHSIRVNAASAGEYDEQLKLAADGLRRLSEFAKKFELNVIVENHGGLSSNGKWLASVIESVGLENCGTLPDFGNFHSYDRYQGVKETMPYAKAVSAKSRDFDGEGNETHTDYFKMMDIVLSAGYHGWVGIEYEGSKLDEYAGIRATKKLLERVLAKVSA
ncbi:MAG: sugar phosphate isomerase/epimerase family protein [Pirellulaceae bacterium]